MPEITVDVDESVRRTVSDSGRVSVGREHAGKDALVLVVFDDSNEEEQ